MKNKLLKTFPFILIILIVFTSLLSKENIMELNIANEARHSSNILDSTYANDDIPRIYDGYKKVSINFENNIISFNNSNTVTELDYSVINAINMSDKSKWSIMTNNLVEDHTFENSVITINDQDIDTVSISFIYNDNEYNLSLIKDEDNYILVENKIKLIHGNLNSLWYQYFYNIEDAIKAANKNDYIIIYDDIDVNHTINVDKTINIMSDPSTIHNLNKENGYMFNITGKNVKVNITNILVNTDSFVKGKYTNNKIILNNSKVVYKNKVYSNKGFKNNIKPDIDNTFIKASL